MRRMNFVEPRERPYHGVGQTCGRLHLPDKSGRHHGRKLLRRDDQRNVNHRYVLILTGALDGSIQKPTIRISAWREMGSRKENGISGRRTGYMGRLSS